MRILLERLSRIIDPFNITKIWTVHCATWAFLRDKSFWTKRAAEEWVAREERHWLFIDLENELTGSNIRLKDNPGRVAPPLVDFGEDNGSEVWDEFGYWRANGDL